MFGVEVLDVLELCEWLCVSVVWHTCSSAVGHSLKVTVAAHGGVVLVLFLVAM